MRSRPSPASLRPAPPTSAFEARLCLLIGRHVVLEPSPPIGSTPPSRPRPFQALCAFIRSGHGRTPRPRPSLVAPPTTGPTPSGLTPRPVGAQQLVPPRPALSEARSVSQVGRRRSSRSCLPATGPAPRPRPRAPPPRDRPRPLGGWQEASRHARVRDTGSGQQQGWEPRGNAATAAAGSVGGGRGLREELRLGSLCGVPGLRVAEVGQAARPRGGGARRAAGPARGVSQAAQARLVQLSWKQAALRPGRSLGGRARRRLQRVRSRPSLSVPAGHLRPPPLRPSESSPPTAASPSFKSLWRPSWRGACRWARA